MQFQHKTLGRLQHLERIEMKMVVEQNLQDNIRMDLKEIGVNTRNRIDSAQDRDYWRDLVNVALDLRVP